MASNSCNLLREMRFSWAGVVLAPLVVPVMFAALMVASNPGKSPVFGFLLLVLLGGIVSYGATIFLLLPGLLVLSRLIRLHWASVAALGFVLGVATLLPVDWIMFKSSGPDSGPPQGTFIEFFWRSRGDSMNWMFPIAGLITSGSYWAIGVMIDRRRPAVSAG